MVMRNRSDGSGPPQARDRFAPLAPEAEPADRAAEPPPPLGRGELLRDLSRLAVLFALVALGNILFLLVALSFVNG